MTFKILSLFMTNFIENIDTACWNWGTDPECKL